jgi:hypothetical protein
MKMDNNEKSKVIRPWINEQERVTVDFVNERDLNAEVIDCTGEVVSLALETTAPHMKQRVTLPLREVEVGEDRTHYTRDPDEPARRGRLRLIVNAERPVGMV